MMDEYPKGLYTDDEDYIRWRGDGREHAGWWVSVKDATGADMCVWTFDPTTEWVFLIPEEML